ncbi:hypothetical protein D3C80_1877940 [compost metagenome]
MDVNVGAGLALLDGSGEAELEAVGLAPLDGPGVAEAEGVGLGSVDGCGEAEAVKLKATPTFFPWNSLPASAGNTTSI